MHRYVLTIMCALVVASTCSVVAAPKSTRLTKREQLHRDLRKFYVTLDDRLFGEKDYKAVEKLLRKTERDDLLRPLVISLLAQYERKMERDPVAGLCLLAPEVLGKDKGKQWVRAYRTADAAVQAKHHKAVLQAHADGAEAPERPAGLSHPFPHEQMKITHSNVDCAMEVARCLMELNQIQEALAIIDDQGKAFEREGRVLAYECLGDLLLQVKMFDKSVKSYSAGLKQLAHIKPTEGYDAWQKRILERLKRKLAEAKRLQEMDRLGPEYVAYRNAEVKRRREHAYLDAIRRYGVITAKYPKTVFAEASKCYRIKCYLELAKSNSLPKSAKEAIKKLEQRLKKERDFIALAKKHKVPKASISEFEETAARIVAQIEGYKNAPVGKKALAKAKGHAREFVRESQWGLYRGEVLVDLGEFCLLEELDLDTAEKYFRQGMMWSGQAPKMDRSLALYQIPGKSQKVAAPPKTSIHQDKWGNVKYNDFAPGQVLNRRTSDWYLGMVQSRLLKYVGFLAFVEGNMATAKAHFYKMGEVDQRIQYLVGKRMPNMQRRLLVRCDAGAFRRSKAEDLKCFRDKKRRFIVFLADFFAETEEPTRAAGLYSELLKGAYGKISKEEEAYLRFSLSWALWYDGVFRSIPKKKQQAVEISEAILKDKRLQKTRCAPRALNALANMVGYSDPKKGIARSRSIYRFVSKNYPKTQSGEDALFYLARRCLYKGQNNQDLREEGWKALTRLLKLYPDSRWGPLAKKMISKRETEDKSQEAGKQEKTL